MRRIRRSRSSYRRRKWRPWLMLALTLAIVTLIAVLLAWSQPTLPSPGRMIEISTSASGAHRLDGKDVSLAELETRLSALQSHETGLFAAIASPSRPNGAGAWPAPEIEALLARLKISWVARPDITPVATPKDQGGDHGR